MRCEMVHGAVGKMMAVTVVSAAGDDVDIDTAVVVASDMNYSVLPPRIDYSIPMVQSNQRRMMSLR